MPTIIDSLVVELGIDTRKFDEGQKKSIEQLRKFETDASKHAKGTQKGIDDLVSSFTALQGRLLAIGGLIAAGLGFNRLTQDVTKLNTEMGYLATSLGVSAKELAGFENLGKIVGSSAGEMAAGFKTLKDSLSDLQLGDGSKLAAFANATNQPGQGPAVRLFNRNGTKRDPDEVLVDMARWWQAQPDKAVASRALETKAGLGRGLINAIQLGPEELQKQLKAMRELGPSSDQIKRFQEMTKAFGEFTALVDRLATIIVDKFTPGMTKVLNMINEWLGGILKNGVNPDAAKAAAEGMVGITPGEAPPPRATTGPWTRFNNWWRGRVGLPPVGGGEAPAGSGAAGGGGTGAGSGPGAAPGGGTPSAPGAVGPGGSEFLRRERQSFTEQASDPDMRERLRAIALSEGGRNPTRVIESLANRFGYVNAERVRQGLPPVTLDQMTTGAFYGPIRRGELPGHIATLRSNPALSERMDQAIRNVSGGSNTVQGYTDQGLRSDPNGWRMPRLEPPGDGNIYNDWNGGGRLGAGDYRNAAAYRERLQAGVAAEQVARNTESRFPTWLPGAQVKMAPGQQLWNSRGFGGASSALLRGGDTSTTNTNTSSTHIGEMNVMVPPGADPAAYGNGIRQELQRFDNVQQSNTGLQ